MPKYRFEDIAFNITQKRKPTADDMKTYIGLEHLDSGSLSVSRWGSNVPIKGDKLIMQKGDILFGKRNAYLRRASIAPHDGLFSAHGMILRPNEKVISLKLFPFFICSDYFFDATIRISVGSLSPTINWSALKELEFNLPEMDEQEKLAELLWAANDTKESYKKLLTLTDELVKSQFIEMFGEPYSNSKCLPVHRIGEVCDVTKLAGFEYTSHINYQDSGDVIMIKGLNVKEKRLKLEELSYIDASVSDSLPRSQLRENDVVMTYIGINIGDVAIVDGENRYHLAPNVAKIMIKDQSALLPIFLVNQMYYSRDKIVRDAGNTAKAVLNMDKIRKIEIMLPNVEQQKLFVDFVEQTDKSKFELKQNIDNLEITIKALMSKNYSL